MCLFNCVCVRVFVLSESKLKLESPSISKTRRKWSVKTAKESNKKTRLQWKWIAKGGGGKRLRGRIEEPCNEAWHLAKAPHRWRRPATRRLLRSGRVYRLLFAWPTLRTAAIIDATVAATAIAGATLAAAAPTAALAALPPCPQFGLHFTKSPRTLRCFTVSAFAIWAPQKAFGQIGKLHFAFSFFIFHFSHFHILHFSVVQ